MPKPSEATRQWAGKTKPKYGEHWIPHKGPFKLIKLPPQAGITPPMTAKEFESGRNISGSWMW